MPEEVPPKWGLIYVYEDGRVEIIKGKKFPSEKDENRYTFQQNYELEYWMLYALVRKAVSWGIGSDGFWKYNKDDFVDKDEYYAMGETPPSEEETEDEEEELEDDDVEQRN